ncbi:hypothetical protein GCM10010286_02870 [Streptomyces toxytricini]|nr:hypothetical protein GCM10010286_02870 [Streptomyces toxytricini]
MVTRAYHQRRTKGRGVNTPTGRYTQTVAPADIQPPLNALGTREDAPTSPGR